MWILYNFSKLQKLYRRKTKEPPFFIGPFFLHASSKTEVFEEFFKTIEIGLQEIADEKCYVEDWKSKLIFVSDQEQSLVNAIDSVFPTATRILCSRHISGNIKANCLDFFKTKFKTLLEDCDSFTKFNGIKNNIFN